MQMGPLFWAIGAEGRGLRPLSMEVADFMVAIAPTNPTNQLQEFAIDSLNVSNAVAVSLFMAKNGKNAPKIAPKPESMSPTETDTAQMDTDEQEHDYVEPEPDESESGI